MATEKILANVAPILGHQPRRLTRAEIGKLPELRVSPIPQAPIQDFEVTARAHPRLAQTVPIHPWKDESSIVVPGPFPIPIGGWQVDQALGSLDPQIAVSNSHVIVTTTSQIAFYSRNGSLLKLIGASAFSRSVPDLRARRAETVIVLMCRGFLEIGAGARA